MAIRGPEAASFIPLTLLFSLAFFCARFLLDRLVYKPLAIYLFNSKDSKLMNDEARQAKIVKFSESIWKLTYYASVQAWVLLIIKQESWSLDTMQYFEGWPNQSIPGSLMLFDMCQCGFYIYSIGALIAWETRRKDFAVMMSHHVITSILIGHSYLNGFFRIGTIILALHDASDVFLETAKLCKYTEKEFGASLFFVSTLNHPAAAAAAGRGKSFSPAAPAAPSVRLSRRWPPAPAAVLAAAVEADAAADRVSALSQVAGVLGSQWGDEGKGKLVDVLAPRFDIVARCQGGANAGHTIYNSEGKKFALHLVPSGILHEGTLCVVGNGAVIHVPGFFDEIDGLESNGVSCNGRILVSDRAHLLFDLHQAVDGLREAELANSFIGTTKRGIGPCYSSKVTRNGLRVCDLRHMDTFGDKLDVLLKDAASRFEGFKYSKSMLKEEVERYKRFVERLEPFIADTVHVLNESIQQKKKILVEGGQATMLDIDFGTYPFVTSSSPSAGGICTGLGIAPRCIGDLIGVVKAYTTRVGSGPFPTELFGEEGDLLRNAGMEFGTTTGRPRRCGWLDIVALKYCCEINGFSSLNLTKLDVLSGLPEIKLGVSYNQIDGQELQSFPGDLDTLEQVQVKYEVLPGWQSDISSVRSYNELPQAARRYVERIEELVGVPVHYIGVGPGRDALIYK